MPVERIYVILNPTAGRGAAVRAWPAVRRELEAAGVEHALAETRAPGHAVELAEEAARDGWPAVLALGGDGTVHEVANGLLRAAGEGPTLPLGIVAVGSGNDFATLAGVPRDPAAAARRALAGEPRPVDAGRVGGEWFTNGVGIGLDARVAVEANRHRRLKGIGIYLWALLRVLRTFRPPRIRLEVDGETIERRLTLVTVGNGGRHGGGFWICPAARIDDGVLDVCVCDALGTLGILRFLPKVLRGTHVGAACVRMRHARRVRVTSPDPLSVHADGEILFEDARALEIEIVPGKLRLLG
jgi:diacylglycerol kinase (ATP)